MFLGLSSKQTEIVATVGKTTPCDDKKDRF
jgi:hypothetical protein